MGNENEQKLTLREAIAQGFDRMGDETDATMTDESDQHGSVNANDAAQSVPYTMDSDSMQQANGADTGTAPAPDTPPVTTDAAAANGSPIGQAEPETQTTSPAAQNDNGQIMQFLLAQFQQMQAQNQQLAAQNQQLAAQLQQAHGTMQQQSQAAEAAIDSTMTQPSVTIPVLDINELQYDDDAVRAKKMADWQAAIVQNITDSVAAQYAATLAPIQRDMEEKRRIADRNAAKGSLYGDPRFSDFKDRDAQIENIIQSTPELGQMPADRRYLLAGLVARGLNYQAQPTAEEIVKLYESSPDAQRMIDAAKARKIADRNGQIPTIMPSTGLSTANAVPEQSPKTKEDLFRRVNDRFRRLG